jgi:DNA-directed RNA polymerase subunit M/transcription elongation factor TFIIS
MQTAPPRSCPRCSGSMLFEEDWHGAYSTCLSCGYVYEFGATAALELEAEGEHRQRRRQPSHGKLRL